MLLSIIEVNGDNNMSKDKQLGCNLPKKENKLYLKVHLDTVSEKYENYIWEMHCRINGLKEEDDQIDHIDFED